MEEYELHIHEVSGNNSSLAMASNQAQHGHNNSKTFERHLHTRQMEREAEKINLPSVVPPSFVRSLARLEATFKNLIFVSIEFEEGVA